MKHGEYISDTYVATFSVGSYGDIDPTHKRRRKKQPVGFAPPPPPPPKPKRKTS